MNAIGELRGPQPYRPVVALPLALPAWLLLCVGGGMLSGALFPPDAWFQGLQHPSFAPPDAVFAPVWLVLYMLMAFAMWRVGEAETPNARFARVPFLVQLGLNFAWAPLFFGLHSINGALAVIIALWVAIMATIVAFNRVDRFAAKLMLPYLAWVTFAMILNGGYSFLNSAKWAFLR